MSKFMISGFYGAGNVGDEAILEAMLTRITNNHKDAECFVISKNQRATKSDHNVETIGRNDFSGFFKHLLSTDVLISGGGSLLQDVTSKKSLAYYIGIIFSGVVFRKKIMLYSHGIGPINSKKYRKLVGFLLNRVDYITVREEKSKIDLIAMKVKSEKIYVTADPVINFDLANIDSRDTIIDMFNLDKEKPIIGISIKSRCIVSTEEKLNEFRDMLVKLSNKYNIILLPFYFNEDIKVIEEVMNYEFINKIKNDDNLNIVALDKEASYSEIIEMVCALDILVGERLHSLIFAAAAEVPLIGVSYDPKIDYFLESIKCQSLFKASNFDCSLLLNEIENLYENRIAFKEELSYNVQRLKKKLNKNDELLECLLSEG
ncbi:MAG: polysaccharide pyruvyl transferase CsaB [Acidaminobacteraceae bacterium]